MFLKLLVTFFFLLAAVIEVDVLRGELKAAWYDVHHSHQLTVLPQDQLLLLTRFLCFNPEEEKSGSCFNTTG